MNDADKTWQELRESLSRYVRTRVDANAADDLVHDILVRVLQNEDKLAHVDNPLAWIYTVAKNVIADHYRRQSRIHPASGLDNLEIEDGRVESLPESLDVNFTACLRPLIDRLQPKYKEALLLTDINQAKQTEAAEEIGISLSGMKSRVQRARTQLKKELLACCSIEVDRFGRPIDYKVKENTDLDSCC